MRLRTACFLWTAFWLTGVAFTIAVFSMLLTPRSARLGHEVVRLWSRALLWVSGIRLVVQGREFLQPDQARLLVGNHASYLDPPALMAAFPGGSRFVLKRELLKLPFIGWFSWLGGHFLIDRSRSRQGAELLERATRHAARFGLSPVVFPEGTRTADGLLGPLKAGAFELALAGMERQGELAIQPVAILGTFDLMPRTVSAPRHAGDVIVRFGPPLPLGGQQGSPARRALAERTRAALLELGVPGVL